MSTVETTQSLPVPYNARPQPVLKVARPNAPIVPPGSVTGRSLTLVIAIMGFLASLTACGVYVVFNAANVWTSKISAEITVQIQQRAGEMGDEKTAEITKFLTDQNGIMRVKPFKPGAIAEARRALDWKIRDFEDFCHPKTDRGRDRSRQPARHLHAQKGFGGEVSGRLARRPRPLAK